MNLGEKLKQIRKDYKMSQEDLAETLNVTRQTVSNWENGKNYPDIETLIQISDTFSISLDVLLKENMVMVRKMDQKIKDTKKYKTLWLMLVFLILICLFSLGIYSLQYHKTKTKLENHFIKTLQEQQFLEKKGNFYEMTYQENIIFKIEKQQFPHLWDFSLSYPSKVLYCNIDIADGFLELVWSKENGVIFYVQKKEQEIDVSSTSLKEEDIQKISEEAGIEKSTLYDILEKGASLYQAFYP